MTRSLFATGVYRGRRPHVCAASDAFPLRVCEVTRGIPIRYYSFSVGPVHFLQLNTETPLDNANIDPAQATWVWRDLLQARSNSNNFSHRCLRTGMRLLLH